MSLIARRLRVKDLDWSQMASSPATVDLLAALVRFTKPKIIAEAGAFQGNTALTLAAVLEHDEIDGHVYTCDPDPDMSSRIKDNDLEDYISFFHCTFEEMLPMIPTPIDFCYLDGGDRWAILGLVESFLRVGALVCIDDTFDPDWPGAKEIVERADLQLDHERGLSIIKYAEV